jgi:hypothetical protein
MTQISFFLIKFPRPNVDEAACGEAICAFSQNAAPMAFVYGAA